MRNYELTVVLPEKATPAKAKAVTSTIEKMVKVFKGKIAKKDNWGKLDLFYPIKKNKSGVFLHFQLELEPKSADSIDKKIKLEEDIIRHLLIRA